VYYQELKKETGKQEKSKKIKKNPGKYLRFHKKFNNIKVNTVTD